MDAYKLLANVLNYHLGQTYSSEQLALIKSNCDNCNDLVQVAEIHGVAPLFYLFLQQQDVSIDLGLKRQFQSLALRHKHAAQVRAIVLAQIISLFEQNSIQVLLLKGAALANMIYCDPMYRPMRDIDVLISNSNLDNAKLLLEQAGFKFDQQHPSIYMGNTHHLPNATKKIESLTISLELHHNVYSRDVSGFANLELLVNNAQSISLNDSVRALTLDHLSMLNHLCRHTFSLGQEVRLIHQYEILKYLQTYRHEISWDQLISQYKFILNTIRCLHYSLSVPEDLRQYICIPDVPKPCGVGKSMQPYSYLLTNNTTVMAKLRSLFLPSQWWMHVNYNIAPEQSLLGCYIFRHPWRILKDISSRFYYAFKHKVSWSGS